MGEFKQTQIVRQLKDMSSDDLHGEIAKQRAALFDFRRRNAMKVLDNTAAIRAARKQIARSLTILRERELAAEREAK